MVTATAAPPRFTIYTGHVTDVLKELPDASVHCVMTSPPYYGLRGYDLPPTVWDDANPFCEHDFPDTAAPVKPTARDAGGYRMREQFDSGKSGKHTGSFCTRCHAWRGVLGLEPNPAMYIDHLAGIFAAVRRVLRPDGCLFLNVGDSCAAAPYAPWGLKPKDLMGIPHRLAFQLQKQGWLLRQDEIWGKTNPAMEDVQDRATRQHEYVFHFAHSDGYYFDHRAAFVPNKSVKGEKNKAAMRMNADALRGTRTPDWVLARQGHNRRSIHWLNQDQERAADGTPHTACFPRTLVELCLLRGSSNAGVCPVCGTPWRRTIEPGPSLADARHKARAAQLARGIEGRGAVLTSKAHDTLRERNPDRDRGFLPQCIHHGPPVPATILDPFSGTGTTGSVALALGRRYIGIELNPEHAERSRHRLEHGR